MTAWTSPLPRTGPRSTIRVDLTPRASRRIRSLLATAEGDNYGLRVSPRPDGDGPGRLRLSLAPAPHPGDLVLPRNGFDVYVPGSHAARLDGMRIDFVASPSAEGFTVDLPARPPRQRPVPGRPPVPPGGHGVSGPTELVAAVLAAIERIRPVLLADGGDVELVAVTGGVAQVALTGACSGCSAALLTLAGLVERVVVGDVPQIERVELVA
ncbi:MAG TPA: NifU family protein [Kineosporiaceae bacterium]|nr:NifU family protein [Kineosporiaceae bacterium]